MLKKGLRLQPKTVRMSLTEHIKDMNKIHFSGNQQLSQSLPKKKLKKFLYMKKFMSSICYCLKSNNLVKKDSRIYKFTFFNICINSWNR